MHGQQLTHKMKAECDYSSILSTAQRDFGIGKSEAEPLLDAFLQWFSLVPLVTSEHPYVMLKTRVDDIFHAFVQHEDFYQDFCTKYIGRIIHHNPMDDGTRPSIKAGVFRTVELLEHEFGDHLNPALREWRHLLDTGAWVVSCSGCDDGAIDETVVGRIGDGRVVIH